MPCADAMELTPQKQLLSEQTNEMKRREGNLADRLFSCHRYPIRYLVIPKCGCTFVKNVLWRLDHGKPFEEQLRVHTADDQFPRASSLVANPADIRQEHHAFTTVRSPVDRFFSLYTDKVIGSGHVHFVPLRRILTDGYGLNPEAGSTREHTRNCEILIDWLARNIRDGVDIKPNPHWTPQSYRHNVASEFDLKILLVQGLSQQLQLLLGELVPDIGSILTGLDQNKSGEGLSKGDILTPALRKKINFLYKRDREFFVRARDRWRETMSSDPSFKAIPRFSDIGP